MTDDIRQQVLSEFWPQIEAVIRGYHERYSVDGAGSYTVIEFPKLALATAILDAVGLSEPKIDWKHASVVRPVTVDILRTPALSELDRWRIFERDNFTCQRCESRLRLTVDHKLARSKGGTNDEDNLETLCRSCNSTKGDR